jgi:hypothetical protein
MGNTGILHTVRRWLPPEHYLKNWAEAYVATPPKARLCYSPELRVVLAAGERKNGCLLMKTTDGITAALIPTPVDDATDAALTAVKWAPEPGLFCAVGRCNYGAGNYPFSIVSPDGANWTAHTMGAVGSKIPAALVWAADLGIFVALSAPYNNSGDTSTAYASTDGASWTQSTTPGRYFTDACRSPGLGLFCAAINNPAATAIFTATSPDGLAWTDRGPSRPANSARSQAYWAEELKSFALVTPHGTYFSADGVDFISTPVISGPSPGTAINAVSGTFVPGMNRVVVPAYVGNNLWVLALNAESGIRVQATGPKVSGDCVYAQHLKKIIALGGNSSEGFTYCRRAFVPANFGNRA